MGKMKLGEGHGVCSFRRGGQERPPGLGDLTKDSEEQE